ncbi:MAG: neutral/alkaline non-lysosomal ceramidase N-terminal domain-containing protein [Promethearchaeota archaeon]
MKAAFGKIVITPPNSSIGVPMAGYSRQTASTGKLDDLFARAVLIDTQNSNTKNNNNNKTERVLLISLDVLKISLSVSKYLNKKLLNNPKFGLRKENILLHAIHTHSAPDMTGEFYWPGGALGILKGLMFGINRSDKYVVYICQRIVKMVGQMVDDLQPATMAVASKQIQKNIVINRRNPAKKSKKDLTVFTFRKKENKQLFGVLATYGMHPTTLSFQNSKISAEYPGRLCHHIESKSNNKISAVFFTGPAGDLNPITTCGDDFDSLQIDPKAGEKIYDQLGDYEHTKKIGAFLGEEAYALANSIKNSQYYDKLKVYSIIKEIVVPFEDSQPYIYDFGIWMKNKLILFLKKWLLYPVMLMNSFGTPPHFPGFSLKIKFKKLDKWYKIYGLEITSILQYLELGLSSSDASQTGKRDKNGEGMEYEKKIGILGVPGEVFEEIEEKLKHHSPAGHENTIIFQNSNSWIGYLFSIKDYIVEGGYEPTAASTPVAGRNVNREFLKIFKRIDFKD